MKICHMTICAQTAIPRLLRESHSAVRAGYRCCIISPGQNKEEQGVEFIGVPKLRGRLARVVATDRAIYKKALEVNADIYQIHDPELLRYAMRLKRKGKAVIFDSHEFYGLQIREKAYIPKPVRNLVATAYTAYETRVCKKMDTTIYVCTVNGRNSFQNRAMHTVFLPNYPETGIFPLPENQTDYSSREESIIYAGALTPDRGITNLAKAAQLAKAKLVLCGPFIAEAYKNEILTTFSDTVEYRGILSPNELAKVYSEVRIGASTLLATGQYPVIDTFPTKVLEYWWTGLPVILSDFPYCAGFIRENNCGLCVPPDDIDATANAIRYLLDHPDVAKQMGKNGRCAVEKRLNWGIHEKKLLELYNKLLNNKLNH